MRPKIVLFFLMVYLAMPILAQNQSSNVFLPKKFLSFQTYAPVYDIENSGIVKQTSPKHINDMVFDKVLNGKVSAYVTNNFDEYFPYDFKVTDTLSAYEINADLSAYKADDKPDLKEVKYYNFIEEWIYDADAFVFEKKVMAFQPVREFEREADVENYTSRKIVFTILNPDNVNIVGTIPIMQVKPEFYFDIPDNIQKYTNIDGLETLNLHGIYFQSKLTPHWNTTVKDKLINSIFDRVLGNSVPVFNKDNGQYIPLSKVKLSLDIKIDSVMLEDVETGGLVARQILREFNSYEIKSMYFVENWFMNPEKLNFRKEVEALIPVRHFYKNYDDTIRTREAVGTIYFDNENKDRLELIVKQLTNGNIIQDGIDGIELFTNLYNQSKNPVFKTLCKEKQSLLLNHYTKQNQGNEQNLKLIQESKQIKL